MKVPLGDGDDSERDCGIDKRKLYSKSSLRNRKLFAVCVCVRARHLKLMCVKSEKFLAFWAFFLFTIVNLKPKFLYLMSFFFLLNELDNNELGISRWRCQKRAEKGETEGDYQSKFSN